jgi:hypothetical protein
MGWRGLWCEPKDLCTQGMVQTIRQALGIEGEIVVDVQPDDSGPFDVKVTEES